MTSPPCARTDGSDAAGPRVSGERPDEADLAQLITVGHGLLDAASFASLLHVAAVAAVVDVRTAPGSRRNPAFARAELGRWLPEAGIRYRWEPRLGGFRRPVEHSPNTALRHEGFRGYADHMRTPEFADALDDVMQAVVSAIGLTAGEIGGGRTTVMCSESVWWRCHRRLIADNVTLARHVQVRHLMHDGRLVPHGLTDGVRLDNGLLVYDGGASRLPGT